MLIKTQVGNYNEPKCLRRDNLEGVWRNRRPETRGAVYPTCFIFLNSILKHLIPVLSRQVKLWLHLPCKQTRVVIQRPAGQILYQTNILTVGSTRLQGWIFFDAIISAAFI